nr:hypothetical protein BaRGS_019440 [Batillaria attramentaria]
MVQKTNRKFSSIALDQAQSTEQCNAVVKDTMDAAQSQQFQPAPGQPYTPSMDHDLMDEVALYNPFRKANSWQWGQA